MSPYFVYKATQWAVALAFTLAAFGGMYAVMQRNWWGIPVVLAGALGAVLAGDGARRSEPAKEPPRD